MQKKKKSDISQSNIIKTKNMNYKLNSTDTEKEGFGEMINKQERINNGNKFV